MSSITVDFSQYLADTTLNGPFDASDTVTLADTSTVLDGLSASVIAGFTTNNVDILSATDGSLTWNEAQFAAFATGAVMIDTDTTAVLADTGADIALLTATQIGNLAAQGLAAIDPTDGVLTFSVAQFDALGAINVDASATFTIADTGATLAGLSAGEIAALGSLGVDFLHATDGAWSISIAQYQSLGTVELTAADTVTLADTGGALGALTASDYAGFGAAGIDAISSTTGSFSLSLADFNALGPVTLDQANTITLADTGAALGALSAGQIDTLAAGGIDVFNATDGTLSLSISQYNETVTDQIALTPANTVTLADTGANLAALTTTQINALVNVDVFNATDTNLTLTAGKFETIIGDNIALTAANNVTISDTAGHLGSLTFSALAGQNVDHLDATTAYTTLTVADLTALGTVTFTSASSVTLTDTGADIAAVSDFAIFAAHDVDTLDASDNALTISEAQFQGLGTTTLTPADTVTISDTAANIIAGASYASLAAAGVDLLNATTAISVTVSDITNLGTVAFTAASTVTLADSGANIAAVADFSTFATHGVDVIDASDNVLTISAAQFGALGTVQLTAGDTVTISDTATELSGLTFSTLAGKNVDFLDSSDAYTTLTVANVTALGAVHFTAASNVTLTDSATDIQAVADFTTFATHGVDTIKSSDNTLSLSVTQFTGLGTTHLTAGDAVTLADTAANIDTYLDAVGTQAALSANGVDTIHATGGSLSVDVAEFSVVHGGGAVFASGDTVTLADTGANIASLDFSTLSGAGIDSVDASDNALTISLAQYQAAIADSVAFTAGDTVTISDTASAFEGLTTTAIGDLASNNIDALSVASGGDLDWSVAQWQALPGGVSVSDAGYELVVDDSEGTVEALTGTQLGALAAQGAQLLASTGGSLNFTVSQAEGLLGTGLAIASGDTGTLADTGATIAGMTATEIGQLATAGFDAIDASDNTLSLTVAQFQALGTVLLTGTDAVTLADTGAHIATYLDTIGASATLSANGVDTIDATDNTLSVDVAGFAAATGAGVAFTAGDSVTIADTATNLGTLTYSALAGQNVDFLNATSAINVTVQNITDLGSVHFTAGSNVTLSDTGADIAALSSFATLATHGVDTIDSSDNLLNVSITQMNSLGTTTLTQADTVTLADTETNIEGLSGPTILSYINKGVDFFHSASGVLTVSTNQLAQFIHDVGTGNPHVADWEPRAHFTASDTVTWESTGNDIALNAPDVLLAAMKAGVDFIDATDDALTLDAGQFLAVTSAGTHFTVADDLTLSDDNIDLGSLWSATGLNTLLSANGVDTITSDDGFINITAAGVAGVEGSGAVLDSGLTDTLADTGAAIAALTTSELSGLSSINVTNIDAIDDTLSISLDQYDAVVGDSVSLTAGDNVTVTGNINGLSTTEIAGFATNNVDHLLGTDLGNLIIWTVAQWNALGTSVSVDNANHAAQSNEVFDSQANLNAVTAAQIANFVAAGAEVWEVDPSGTGTVTWDLTKLAAMGSSFFASAFTRFVISDTSTNLEAVSDFSGYRAHGVAEISASDNALSLTVAQLHSLGVVSVDAANTFTLADTAANLQTYLGNFSASNLTSALDGAGVDFIHATGGTLTVTAAEALGVVNSEGTAFTSGDTVTLADTGANIESLSASYAALGAHGVDIIDATDNVLTLNVSQYTALTGASVALTSGDTVTLADSGTNLSAISATNISALANIDVVDATDDTVSFSIAQLNALAGNNIALTAADTVTLSDTETNVEALTAAQFTGYAAQGVDIFDPVAGSLNLNAGQVAAVVNSNAMFRGTDTVTLVDTGANIAALTATQFGLLSSKGVDAIDATTTLNISVAQFQAVETVLHSATLTLTNPAVLADTNTNLDALTTTEIGQLGTDNFASIQSSGELDWTQAQVTALNGLAVNFTTGLFFVADTEATIEGLSTGTIDADHSAGVSTFHATDHDIVNLTVAQAQHIVADNMSVANGTVTVTDTGANISTLTTTQLNGFGAAGINEIAATSGDIVFTVDQLNADSVDTIKAAGGHFQLLDTEAHIEGNLLSDFTRFVNQGIDQVSSANSDTLQFSAAEATLFETHSVTVLGSEGDLVDTGAHINALTVAQITALAGTGFFQIDASDNAVALSVAQFNALGTVALTAGDTVTLSDTSANLGTLNFSTLAGKGVDTLHSTDGTFTLSVANFNALGTVTFDSANTVTISDTAANITTLSFSTLAAKDIDVLDVTTAFSLSVARYESMGGVTFSSASNVTLSDTGANLAALTAVQIGALAGNGIDTLDTSDNVLTLTVAQFNALGTVALTTGDTVTLADTSANLLTLNFATLAAKGIDVLDATDNVLSLSVAQYTALGTVQLTAGDTVTLADTGAHIAALTAVQFGALADNGIDKIDATNNVLSLNVAQFGALGTVTLTGADTVTLLDTGANLQTLNFSTLASKGVDILDASDNVLTLTAAQFDALGTVSLKSSDTVTLVDTGANISALTVGNFNSLAAKGIDILDASDNAYSLTVNQVNGLGNLTLAANDTVTVQDTEAAIQAETQAQIQNMVTRGVDVIHATNAIDNMSVAQITPLLGSTTTFAAGDTVTLLDTSTNIQALSAVQIGQLAAAGVDKINATDNMLTLTAAQYTALGSVALNSGDTNTISDASVGIDALTTSQIAGLSAEHISAVHSSDSVFWTKAQWDALPGSIAVTASQHVELRDAVANIEALTVTEINTFAAAGMNVIADSGNTELDFSAAQTAALLAHNVAVSNGSAAVVLSDTGSAIDALTATQLGELQTAGFTAINSTSGDVVLSLAQFNALGAVGVSVPAGSAFEVSDTETNIEGLTNSQLHTLNNAHVSVISSQSGSLNIATGQVGALLGTNTHFDFANAVTLVDSGATIAALGAVQISVLANAGIDAINTIDNTLTLSAAQYEALGTVALSAGDTNSISDSTSNLASMSTSVIAGLSAQHISSIASTSNFAWSKAQWDALPTGITITAASPPGVEFVDSPANIVSLTVSEINAFATAGMTEIMANVTGELDFNTAQTVAILTHGITLFNGNGVITITDTGASLATLTGGQIGQLHGIGFTAVDASDGAVTFTKVQIDALAAGSIALTQANTVTMTSAEVNIEGLSATTFANYITQGVDIFHSNSTILSLNESQVVAVIDGGGQFKDSDAVTLADTAANLQNLTATEYGKLAAGGIDIIDITSGALSLNVADYRALGSFTIVGGSVVLTDTGAAIAGLTAAQLGALTGTGITHVDATDNALSLSAAQTTAILHQTGSGSVTFDNTDAITVADLGANIGNLSVADLTALATNGAGHVTIDASDNLLSITSAQYSAIASGGINLTAADFITLADSGANLALLTTAQIAAFAGVIDAMHATDGAVSFSVVQLNALNAAQVALTAADTVTLADTEANIEARTAGQITTYAGQHVDFLHSTNGTLNMNESQVAAVVNSQAAFAAGDIVTLSDTGADIAALSSAQFALLAARGVDQIDASNNVLSLSVAQYSGLGSTTLTQSDAVTIFDAGGHIAGLTVAQFAQLAANGIDHIDSSNNVLSLSVGQFEALGSVTLTQTDVVTLKDTGANLAALTSTQISGLAAAGIDQLDASNNAATFNLAQFEALGTVKLTTADVITLADTGAALGALSATQIGALQASGIDRLDATDNMLSLSVAQFHALHQVTLTAADAVTLSDTGANIATIGAAGIGALAQQGIDTIDATDNAITFTLAQYNALGTVHLSVDDVVTVNGTNGTDLIQGQAGSQILNGGAGDDVLFGGDGNDTLDGGSGNDTLNGGTGIDTVTYADATVGVTVNLVAGTATGGAGTDLLSNIENVVGSNFNDTIQGGSGTNVIDGGAGNDILIGGGRSDTLTGGAGADTFVYQAVSDSPTSSHDIITDFSHAEGDKIDVSEIATFTFVDHFTHHADQLAVINAGGGIYKVVADVNGDGVADMTIFVHSSTALVAGDFIL